MQKLTLAAVAAGCLFAAPVMAQTTGTNNKTPAANNSAASATPATMSQADLQKIQQKITNDLQGDGYTSVQVMPNSFLIHAVNKRKEPVVMIINPDSVFAVTELPGKQANAQTSTSSGTTTKQ